MLVLVILNQLARSLRLGTTLILILRFIFSRVLKQCLDNLVVISDVYLLNTNVDHFVILEVFASSLERRLNLMCYYIFFLRSFVRICGINTCWMRFALGHIRVASYFALTMHKIGNRNKFSSVLFDNIWFYSFVIGPVLELQVRVLLLKLSQVIFILVKTVLPCLILHGCIAMYRMFVLDMMAFLGRL
jgi:hypothetical protein